MLFLCLASLAHCMSVEIHVVSLCSFIWFISLGLSLLGSFPHWGGETKIHLRDQRIEHAFGVDLRSEQKWSLAPHHLPSCRTCGSNVDFRTKA